MDARAPRPRLQSLRCLCSAETHGNASMSGQTSSQFADGGIVMHRRFVLAPGLAVLVALLPFGPLARPAAAEDATPPAHGMQVAPGVTVEEVPSKPGYPPVFRMH